MSALLHHKTLFKILFSIAMIAIFILAIVPDDHIYLEVSRADKLKHFTAFFVLSFLLHRASSTIQHRLRNMSLLLFFGIFIELTQLTLSYRQGSIEDVYADSVGIVLFQLLLSIKRAFNYKKEML